MTGLLILLLKFTEIHSSSNQLVKQMSQLTQITVDPRLSELPRRHPVRLSEFNTQVRVIC